MTPEERKADFDATAAERATTIPEAQPITTANEFHENQDALVDTHGKSRAEFIQKLKAAGLVDDASLPLFLKYLDEYDAPESIEGSPREYVEDPEARARIVYDLNKRIEELETENASLKAGKEAVDGE